MIKFFRGIRQDLVSESNTSLSAGRFSKYILYAVGEIILVVIGILIALQINSWNEYSKNRKIEKEYYLRFKAELEENILNADHQIQYSTFQIKNAQIVEQALEGEGLYPNTQELYLAIEHLGKTYPTQYTNNTWTEMLSNGNSSIIQNQEFREKLALLNSEMLQVLGIQSEINQNNVVYKNMTGDIFSIALTNELNSKIHPRELRDSTLIPNLPNQQSIIEKLKAIKGLGGYVADIYQFKTVNKYLFERHKASMAELVAICEEELAQ
jgi:hypothetical protein